MSVLPVPGGLNKRTCLSPFLFFRVCRSFNWQGGLTRQLRSARSPDRADPECLEHHARSNCQTIQCLCVLRFHHQQAGARTLFVVEALMPYRVTSSSRQSATTALSLTSAFIPGNTSPSSMHAQL